MPTRYGDDKNGASPPLWRGALEVCRKYVIQRENFKIQYGSRNDIQRHISTRN